MQASRLFLFLICLIVPVAASAQTLTCSSDDMGKHYCRANTSRGVQMIHQRSGSACTQGYSWGYDGGGIWVDHGCRADFSLGSGGGNGGGTSPNEAMRWCKNTAGEHLPSVPLAYQRFSRLGYRRRQLHDQLSRPAAELSTLLGLSHHCQERPAAAIPIRSERWTQPGRWRL